MADPTTYRPAPGTIPTDPGVYKFRDENRRVIYVGKAKNLRARLSNYFQDITQLHPRTRQMVLTANSVEWTVVASEVEALLRAVNQHPEQRRLWLDIKSWLIQHQTAVGLSLAVLALGLLWAYSYPPLRLSYRGGGELLQMLGVAGVLPLYGYLAQGGALEAFPWALTAMLLPTHLACAISTALPDEPSDRLGDKRTWAVHVGGERAAWTILALNAVSWALTPGGMAAVGLGVNAGVAVSLVAGLAVVGVRPAPPGSRRMLVRVAAAILATLALVAGAIVGLWGRA